MINNYIKLAIRGMKRRKFFTFISLFGISFTLGILMVILSFLQSELGENAPLSAKDDFVFIPRITLQKIYYDTLTVIDTLDNNGIAVYDTTFEYKKTGTGMSQTSLSHNLASNFLNKFPSADLITEFMNGGQSDVYKDGIKLPLSTLYADQNYWIMFDYNFIEGRPIDTNDIELAAPVIIVSSKTAENYFGRQENIIGEEMVVEEKNYKVIGVYKYVGKFVPFISPDIVMPISVYQSGQRPDFYMGPSKVMIKKKSHVSVEQMKTEVNEVSGIIPLDHPDNKYDYNEILLSPMTYNEMFAQNIYYDPDPGKSYRYAWWIIYSLLAFFILLPTLNLINLNVSRIMDRSSEIGVRKAFGAHRGNVIFQFVIENIVQTIIGGILGLLLAIVIIKILNNGGYLGEAQLVLYPKFYIYSFIATLIFGILSGLIPALKMSNLQIVNALKENKL